MIDLDATDIALVRSALEVAAAHVELASRSATANAQERAYRTRWARDARLLSRRIGGDL